MSAGVDVQVPPQPAVDAERRERCNAIRDRIFIGRQANYEAQDKAILTLTSGALAVSISFITTVVPLQSTIWMPALISSWILFGAAIVATFASFLTSQRAHDVQLENVELHRAGDEGALDDRRNTCLRQTKCLNIVSSALFVVGLVFTVVFASVNVVNRRGELRQEHKPIQPDERRGIVPPAIPKPVSPPPRQPIQTPPQPGKN